MKILVPIDFSNHARNACHYALHIAAHTHGEVHIFHAYRLPVVDPVMPMDYLGELTENIRQKAESDLQQWHGDMLDYITRKLPEHQMTIEFHKELGFPADEILKCASQLMPDLILIGTRHLDGFRRFLAGSIHSVLIAQATAPVWVIPENIEFPGIGALKFLFAVNLEPSDASALKRLIEVAEPLRAKIRIIHFAPEKLHEVDKAKSILQDQFGEFLSNPSIQLMVVEDNQVFEGLLDQIEQIEEEVVVLLTRKRDFFDQIFSPSLTEKWVKKSPVPLLALRSDLI